LWGGASVKKKKKGFPRWERKRGKLEEEGHVHPREWELRKKILTKRSIKERSVKPAKPLAGNWRRKTKNKLVKLTNKKNKGNLSA